MGAKIKTSWAHSTSTSQSKCLTSEEVIFLRFSTYAPFIREVGQKHLTVRSVRKVGSGCRRKGCEADWIPKSPVIMSGTPAIDTRSQNSFIKQKQSKKKAKGKANKKAKKM